MKNHMKFIKGALLLLLLCNTMQVNGKRFSTSKKKSPSGTSHSSKPSYPTQSYGHSDMTKLSYGGGTHSQPSYGGGTHSQSSYGGGTHSQPSHGTSNHGQGSAPIGWNVPNKQAGPPPAYSPTNPVGGAKTNIHEPPPGYKPASTHQENIVPVRTQQSHAVPAQTYQGHAVPAQTYQGHAIPAQTYHPAGGTYHSSVPAGATYHSSVPAGATYYNSPPGGSNYNYLPHGATYHSSGALPVGATYYASSNAIPHGATYYPQAPQSSGPGLGTGLIAGALGGAILGHVLTPSGTQVVHAPPSTGTSNSGGEDRVIIINNGPPGSVTTNDVGHGTTVINTGSSGAVAQPAVNPVVSAAAVNPVAPAAAVPLAPMSNAPVQNVETPIQAAAPFAEQNAAAPPPAPGGIICVPVRVNDTDPNDPTKMIEVEKIACYPAPPPPPPETTTTTTTGNVNLNAPAVTAGAPAAVIDATNNKDVVMRSSLERSGTNKNVPEMFISTILSLIIVYAMRF